MKTAKLILALAAGILLITNVVFAQTPVLKSGTENKEGFFSIPPPSLTRPTITTGTNSLSYVPSYVPYHYLEETVRGLLKAVKILARGNPEVEKILKEISFEVPPECPVFTPRFCREGEDPAKDPTIVMSGNPYNRCKPPPCIEPWPPGPEPKVGRCDTPDALAAIANMQRARSGMSGFTPAEKEAMMKYASCHRYEGGGMSCNNPKWQKFAWMNGEKTCVLVDYSNNPNRMIDSDIDGTIAYKKYVDNRNTEIGLKGGNCLFKQRAGDDQYPQDFGICYVSGTSVIPLPIPVPPYVPPYPYSGGGDLGSAVYFSEAFKTCMGSDPNAVNAIATIQGWFNQKTAPQWSIFTGELANKIGSCQGGGTGYSYPATPMSAEASCKSGGGVWQITQEGTNTYSKCVGGTYNPSTYTPPSGSTGTSSSMPAAGCPSGQYWNGFACMTSPSGGSYSGSTMMSPDEGCKKTYGTASSWNGTKCVGGSAPTANVTQSLLGNAWGALRGIFSR